MKRFHAILVAAACLLPFLAAARTTENFEAGWKFFKGAVPTAKDPAFNDHDWRKRRV
jgi:hypothetical protein